MSSIPISLRDQLIGNLRGIEGQTREIFMILAESLPSLVSEMKHSLSQSENAIHGMGAAGDTDITALVTSISQEMKQGAQQIRELSDRDSLLFERLQHGIQQLEEISTSIAGIRADSEDMELVSLNAMTVALKAGTAGRAFSYITEELKRLANQTITLSEDISRRGTDLINNFRELERSLNDARKFQGELVSGVETRISGGLNALATAVQNTVHGLSTLREESLELKQPVNGMMEAIQLQDIIRQSIDHIILALEAIRPESELSGETALLDELAFTRQIPALAARLIDDVSGQIDRSVETFLSLTNAAEKKLNELETGRKSFLADNIDTGSGELMPDVASPSMTLDQRFHHSSQMLQRLLDDLEHNLQKKESLVSRSGTITREVEVLEAQFQRFTTLVTRFHSIDIASRIEVAKQEVLRRMGSSADQMTVLTRTIEGDVNRSLEATREFIKSTSNIIESHGSHVKEETHFVKDFSASIRQRYDLLSDGREQVIQVVRGFSLFTDGFLGVFTESKQNGRRLATLSEQILGLKADLERMQEMIDARYQEELQQQGMDNWVIKNDRLKEIIERFTIFTHKQQAGDLVGLTVEDGVGAGDITLF